jgi:predicted signal transduction protein with EAL and GGDEF domain
MIDGRSVSVGASVGVALFPQDATDVATLLRAADGAMYRAKRAGGGASLAH